MKKQWNYWIILYRIQVKNNVEQLGHSNECPSFAFRLRKEKEKLTNYVKYGIIKVEKDIAIYFFIK